MATLGRTNVHPQVSTTGGGPPDPRKPGKTVPNKGHYAKKMMTLQREVRDLRMMRQTIQFRRYHEQEIVSDKFHSIGDSSDETGETGRPG